jgi:hypothetical protein
MRIDPVILVLDELTTRNAFFAGDKNEKGGIMRAPRSGTRSLVRGIMMHFHKFPAEVEQITAIGAGTLTLLAAECLHSEHAHSDCLESIGHRLSAGNRLLPDLIKLRELLRNSHEMHLGFDTEIRSLLELSMKGASMPLLIFRSVDENAASAPRRTNYSYRWFEHLG